MIVFLNGQLLPEERAVVSVFDRGFLYGDGLFETLLLRHGKPFEWARHLDRLRRGARFLQLEVPYPDAELWSFVQELAKANGMPDAVLRIQLLRGVGPRGYAPAGVGRPTLVMTLHPAPLIDSENPPRWRLTTSTVHLPSGGLRLGSRPATDCHKFWPGLRPKLPASRKH